MKKYKYIRKHITFKEKDYERLDLEDVEFSKLAKTSMLILKIQEELESEKDENKRKKLKEELEKEQLEIQKIRLSAKIKRRNKTIKE